jgi:hypothetical protein
MSCSFDIRLVEAPTVYIDKARSTVQKLKGDFSGDEAGGRLSVDTVIGTIAAAYSIRPDNVMHIEVLEKPFLLSCEKIKTVLREYLG